METCPLTWVYPPNPPHPPRGGPLGGGGGWGGEETYPFALADPGRTGSGGQGVAALHAESPATIDQNQKCSPRKFTKFHVFRRVPPKGHCPLVFLGPFPRLQKHANPVLVHDVMCSEQRMWSSCLLCDSRRPEMIRVIHVIRQTK